MIQGNLYHFFCAGSRFLLGLQIFVVLRKTIYGTH